MPSAGRKEQRGRQPENAFPHVSIIREFRSATISGGTTATEAGARTKAKVDDIDHGMSIRRNEKWGTLEDQMDVTNTPRREGEGGPDIQAMHGMARLIDRWMQGATTVAADVDRQVNKKASHVMKAIGYSGKY